MRRIHDPERTERIRIAAGTMLGLAGFLVLAAIGMAYGQSGGGLNNGLFGILVALLAVFMLRSPFGSAVLCWLTGLAGLWLAASPYVLGFLPYTLTTAVTVWVGLMTALLSAFIYGEAQRLNQPLEATD